MSTAKSPRLLFEPFDAFVFVRKDPKRPSKSISGPRRELVGVARVRVEERFPDGTYRVTVTKARALDRLVAEQQKRWQRHELYFAHHAAENDWFGANLSYLWGYGKNPHPGPRPEIEQLSLF